MILNPDLVGKHRIRAGFPPKFCDSHRAKIVLKELQVNLRGVSESYTSRMALLNYFLGSAIFFFFLRELMGLFHGKGWAFV